MLFQFVFTLVYCLGVWARVDDGSPAFELKGRFIQERDATYLSVSALNAITDMHPDSHYLEGSLVRSACHKMEGDDNSTATPPPKRKYDRTNPTEDVPYDSFGADFDDNDNRTAGYFGVPDGPCDTPFPLINATFEYIRKVWKDQIDFIVWTGDNARHDNDNNFPRSPSHIYDSNRLIRNKFYEIFQPDNPLYPLTIPIIPSFGNNDVWPHNIFAPGPNYQTRSYASLWSDMIPEYELHTFERGGYFAVEVVPNKLAVVSLNTLYWFNSNAAVDGCDHKSEPGSQQFEWLKVQLTEYRKRGVKAYLTGHVPPGKKFYYASCYRRYTLWSHAFRDVILGHLYGHNNMDHFFMLDAKQALKEEEEAEMLKSLLNNEIPRNPELMSHSELEILTRLSEYSSLSTLLDSPDFRAFGAEEYITDLKEMFESIPERPKPKKGKKDKKDWQKKVVKYEENYQIVQVAPSIIPAYFSAIRVFEYNVSELAGVQFHRQGYEVIERTNWTEWWAQMDRELTEEKETSEGLTFQTSFDTFPSEKNLHPHHQDLSIEKKKKKSKKKPAPPSIRLPPGPHKSAPRGPIYESQLFSPIRWEVHFVNLTAINEEHEKYPERKWDYGKDFFKMEYSSDAAPYNMKDLTVGTWLDLGIKIGKEKTVDKTKMAELEIVDEMNSKKGKGNKKGKGDKKGKDNGDAKKGGARKDKETFWDVFLRRAFVNCGHKLEFGDE